MNQPETGEIKMLGKILQTVTIPGSAAPNSLSMPTFKNLRTKTSVK
jgi:hypothetical protein